MFAEGANLKEPFWLPPAAEHPEHPEHSLLPSERGRPTRAASGAGAARVAPWHCPVGLQRLRVSANTDTELMERGKVLQVLLFPRQLAVPQELIVAKLVLKDQRSPLGWDFRLFVVLFCSE